MLTCKKCSCAVSERTAQQSFCDMETLLLERNPAIAARRKAMNYGPLCDACLSQWQDKYEDAPADEPQLHRPNVAAKSTALEQLEAACQRMAPPEMDLP